MSDLRDSFFQECDDLMEVLNDGLTALDEGEIITAVKFPVPQAANYQKFEQPASRFALTGVFVAKYGDRVGVAGHRQQFDALSRRRLHGLVSRLVAGVPGPRGPVTGADHQKDRQDDVDQALEHVSALCLLA